MGRRCGNGSVYSVEGSEKVYFVFHGKIEKKRENGDDFNKVDCP